MYDKLTMHMNSVISLFTSSYTIEHDMYLYLYSKKKILKNTRNTKKCWFVT